MDLVNAMLSFAESLNLMLCMARFRPEGLLCSARVRVGTSASSRPGIVWARLPVFEFGFGNKFHGTLYRSYADAPVDFEVRVSYNGRVSVRLECLMRCLVAVLRNPADLGDFIGVLVGPAFGARAAQLPLALARALQRWQRVDGYLAPAWLVVSDSAKAIQAIPKEVVSLIIPRLRSDFGLPGRGARYPLDVLEPHLDLGVSVYQLCPLLGEQVAPVCGAVAQADFAQTFLPQVQMSNKKFGE